MQPQVTTYLTTGSQQLRAAAVSPATSPLNASHSADINDKLSHIIKLHNYTKHKMQPIVAIVAWSVCVC